ncbi:WD40-repeat-containing domain protein [Halteromyces radiatus]|uniref:WD40-repeat-containing domain protein n=1 Tax=Halteromyces radiatus TaxID=101107 RepID=UPI00221EEACD|nr:WD40-repeat-containing domain protein [Halteromyces radiatus]KAI8099532.1 WD40-repeat-containing domain protein [Halteromyces radiatus]
MRLKRIVKENHGQDINQMAFFFNNKNFAGPVGLDVNKTFDKRGAVQREQHDTSNVVGTVGGAQMNVYDNEHCGDHLDIMSNFNLASTLNADEEPNKKFLHTFCWIYQEDDAVVATGGMDGDIHILSIANSKEIAILKGHTKRILDLQSHPKNDKYIFSVSKDGTMRLWDLETQKCIIMFEYECNVACFHPSGETFITGTTKGELREWTIPTFITPMDDDDDGIMVVGKSNSRLLKRMHGESTIGNIYIYI